MIDLTQLPAGLAAANKVRRGEKITNEPPFAEIERKTLDALNNEDFDGLDRMAGQARNGKERVTGGSWKIRTIYSTLTSVYTDEILTEPMWEAQLAKLKKWKEHSPNSITARVAVAETLIGYAWFARGTSYANLVKPLDGQKMHERVDLAYAELSEAGRLEEKCPEWFDAMLSLGTIQSWNQQDYERLLTAAVKFEPDYYYYYYNVATHLLPRWGGRPGDAEKFIDAIEKTGAREKEILYYLYAANIINDWPKDWIDHQSFSWQRVKAGYHLLEKNYGSEKRRMNEYAVVAMAFGDGSEANRIFQKIGDNWDRRVYSEKKFKELKFQAEILNSKEKTGTPPQDGGKTKTDQQS